MEDVKEVWKDLAAGTVAGIAQLLVGHPFDTIKVKLQSQARPAAPGQAPHFTGAMDALRKTVVSEGGKGLYKGMGAPLASVAVFNALLFASRGQMETLVRDSPGAQLSVAQQVICGAGAGTAVSFVACPTELVKCRLQAQSALQLAPDRLNLSVQGANGVLAIGPGPIRYTGPMDVARQVWRSEGGLAGLFKGMSPTLMREVPGSAALFGVYEATKQALAGGTDTSKLGKGSKFVAGGVSGALIWMLVLPADVIKSVIQVDDHRNRKYNGTIDAFKKVFAAEGVRGLYRGFAPAMCRSVPANAACLLAYETAREVIG